MAAVEAPVAITGKRSRGAAPPVSGQVFKRTKRSTPFKADFADDNDHVTSHDESDSDASAPDLDCETQSAVSTPATPVSSRATSTPKPSARPLIYHCDFSGCDKVYSRPSRLEEHKRSHTNERPFKCCYDGCTKAFLRQGHLDHHVKSAHTRERRYACDWEGCDKRFVTAQRLKNHRETHIKKDRYRCSDFPPCDKTFRKHSTLQQHIKLDHLHQKPFPCKEIDDATGEPCTAAFDRAYSLRCHIATFHAGAKFWCTICSADGKDQIQIKKESDDTTKPASPGFATHAELQAHIKSKHPPKCPHCNQTFTTSRELERHTDIQHSGVTLEDRRSYICPHPGCGKGFVKQGNLNIHYRSSHEKRKPFVCGTTELGAASDLDKWDRSNACGRGFTAKASLESHVRKFHLGSDGGLASHARKPSTRQPSAADLATYRQKPSTATRLTGAGYAEESGRQIPCPVAACPHRFKRTADLRQHVRAAHRLVQSDEFDGEAAELRQECEALSGGRFWIGGLDEAWGSESESDDDDEHIARALGTTGPVVDVRGGDFQLGAMHAGAEHDPDENSEVDEEEQRLMRDLQSVVRGEGTAGIPDEVVDPELRGDRKVV